ncbi:hypothetical protein [Nocardia sp. BMG51109]|uniref:hypothetical protein n=1 Tax=Nocardia sp. BMG51109 TaxID=1056816 RepID=UPI0004B1DD90|nr:hypothetical protein [Nocardia sp. BMG51109]
MSIETHRNARTVSLPVSISAWAVPVLVIGQFAMVAILPVAITLIGTLRDTRHTGLRWWAAALTVAYAIPLALWAIGPDRAPSLSKDMHPAFAVLIVAVAIGYQVVRIRSRQKDR